MAKRSLDQQPVQRRGITEIRIMIVEDSEAIHAVWHAMIAGIAGLSVAGGFRCVSSALEGIRRDPPDVVLLDIQLQGESGMKVMQGVAESHPFTKVIVVSNYADVIYRRYYMNAGAYAFFDKSHELKKLRHTLENLAASRATALHSPVQTSNIA
ncbi:MAG: response regulator [Polaromonas sp.]